MGVDSAFRNLLRAVARGAYYPTPKGQYPNVAPGSSCHVGAYVPDFNSMIRSIPLYDGHLCNYGLRTWGEVFDRIRDEIVQRFVSGGWVFKCSLDGKVPENKGHEQQARADTHGKQLEGKREPVDWSKRDQKQWFARDQECNCVWGDVYVFFSSLLHLSPPSQLLCRQGGQAQVV